MYFLPSIIALARNKRDITAIVLLNLFHGWTMIGWVVALVWAAKVMFRVVRRVFRLCPALRSRITKRS